MGDLGEVLELLHTSPDRWNSLRLTGTAWRNARHYHDAWERWVTATHSKGHGSVWYQVFATVTGHAPVEATVKWRLWQLKPNKIRTEFDVGFETVKALIVGDEWWSWTRSRGLKTNRGDPSSSHGVGPGGVLVDTPPLLSSLSLRTESRTTFASRSAYLVSGRPVPTDRTSASFVQHALGPGADRYELIVDAEIGVLLTTQAEWRHEAFYVLEVEDLGVNDKIDEQLFTSDALAG